MTWVIPKLSTPKQGDTIPERPCFRTYLGIYRNKKRIIPHCEVLENGTPPSCATAPSRDLYSFVIFILFAVLAAFSAAHDESFVRGVLVKVMLR
jgi:hypothetical protein